MVETDVVDYLVAVAKGWAKHAEWKAEDRNEDDMPLSATCKLGNVCDCGDVSS